MIGRLTGFVAVIENDQCLIDVQGVGYVVFASTRTLSQLKQPPEVTQLLIETIIREDAFQLYGFMTYEERAWFRLLITVQGVGAKAALAILSVSSPVALYQALQMGDKSVFTQASGVGPRIAARLLTELKEKIDKIPGLVGAGEKLSFQAPSSPKSKEGAELSKDKQELMEHHLIEDAVMALEGLGYKRVEVWSIVQNILSQEGVLALDEVIRLSLKALAR